MGEEAMSRTSCRRGFTLAALVLSVGCQGSAASDESVAVKAAPQSKPGSIAATVNIDCKKFVLNNGLTLIVHEDHKAPIVAVNVWYHVGSKNEKPGKTGFAHLFEHLMFQGSENHDAEWINTLDGIGATNMNGTTNSDRTNYFENVPKNALDTALWLESDRMVEWSITRSARGRTVPTA
jgi:zinc protease